MTAEDDVVPPRCPRCGRALLAMSDPEAPAANVDDPRRRHAYWCPAGCRGPESDGTFELIECPSCGSRDTVASPRGDGVEELACQACGAISIVQILPEDR